MNILVTGFEEFNNESINPSSEVLKLLPDFIDNNKLFKLKLKTVAYDCISQVEEFILNNNIDIIISLGQAGGISDISIEKVGINLNDFRIPDNNGNQILDEPIYIDGANAYFTQLPVKAILKSLNDIDIPAHISYSAGTYICNHLFYGLMYLENKKYKNIKSIFIHIPYLPKQVINKRNMPSMDIDTIKNSIVCIIKTILNNSKDISLVSGEIY